MEIDIYFEYKIPGDSMSDVVFRALQIETPLKPECVQKIAVKEMPTRWRDLKTMGVFARRTRMRISIEDASTSSFARFLYQIVNWEGNTNHTN